MSEWLLTTKVTYLKTFFSMWYKCHCAFKCTLSRAHCLSNQFLSPRFVLKACHIKLQFKSSSLNLRSGVTSTNIHLVASLMASWPSELGGVGYQKNLKGETQLGLLLRGILENDFTDFLVETFKAVEHRAAQTPNTKMDTFTNFQL